MLNGLLFGPIVTDSPGNDAIKANNAIKHVLDTRQQAHDSMSCAREVSDFKMKKNL